jgi:hypothetical protein
MIKLQLDIMNLMFLCPIQGEGIIMEGWPYTGPCLPYLGAVLWIHAILVRIWIRIGGSMPLTNGSGSFYFHH